MHVYHVSENFWSKGCMGLPDMWVYRGKGKIICFSIALTKSGK